MACQQEWSAASARGPRSCWAGADVPVTATCGLSPARARARPMIPRSSSGRGHESMVADALERKLYVIRKAASHKIPGP